MADNRDLTSLRCAIVGGDAMTLELHDRFREVTGLEATEVCGMTECFNYSMNPPFAAKRLARSDVHPRGPSCVWTAPQEGSRRSVNRARSSSAAPQ